ncbi:hypothetical protein [Peribacillus frigoritolerans]|uniref:hypothetical protein n=1 Tax=Peribacillus castrilensis TaxID=2897690 RepID=UPI002DCA6DB5|nr:hypothetical protein [Peribacillus castrilensis]
MNLKKVFRGCLVLLLVWVVSACGSDGVSGGSGKVTELTLDEAKEFQPNKETGFVYVRDSLESEEEDDKNQFKEIKRVAEAEEIDFYVANGKDFPQLTAEEWEEGKEPIKILDQKNGTLAYYEDGEMMEEMDFMYIDEEELYSKIEKFVQKIKSDYIDN